MRKVTSIFFIISSLFTIISCDDSDNGFKAQEIESLILSQWTKKLTITPDEREIEYTEGCLDTWNFFLNTLVIKENTTYKFILNDTFNF